MRGRQGPPDKKLFRRARQGDRQAFGILLRRYDPRFRRLAARLIAEPERVDPVLKRAYLRAWRSLPMVVPPSSVAEWLYRIVYNACINEMRWAPDGPLPPPLPGPRIPLPMASAPRRLAGLRALAPEERVPLVLVDAEGFTLEATARILGRSESEVAADLTRARYRWRELVVGDPAAVRREPRVELPAAADDAKPPPSAAPASQEIVPERGGHVKVVGSNGTVATGDDPHHIPPADAGPGLVPTSAGSPRSPSMAVGRPVTEQAGDVEPVRAASADAETEPPETDDASES